MSDDNEVPKEDLPPSCGHDSTFNWCKPCLNERTRRIVHNDMVEDTLGELIRAAQKYAIRLNDKNIAHKLGMGRKKDG